MKAAVYIVLLVAAIFVLRQAVKRRGKGVDRKIDIVAYSIIVAGLAFLAVTCIVEIVIGGPIVQPR